MVTSRCSQNNRDAVDIIDDDNDDDDNLLSVNNDVGEIINNFDGDNFNQLHIDNEVGNDRMVNADNLLEIFLYEKSSMTLNKSVIAVLELYFKHKWTKATLKEILELLHQMLPEDCL